MNYITAVKVSDKTEFELLKKYIEKQCGQEWAATNNSGEAPCWIYIETRNGNRVDGWDPFRSSMGGLPPSRYNATTTVSEFIPTENARVQAHFNDCAIGFRDVKEKTLFGKVLGCYGYRPVGGATYNSSALYLTLDEYIATAATGAPSAARKVFSALEFAEELERLLTNKTVQPPEIGGYDGTFHKDDDTIQYGCATIDLELIRNIVKEYGGDRNIKSVELSSGVTITNKQAEQILLACGE